MPTCVYTCVYIHVCTWVYTHVFACVYTHVYKYAHVYTYVPTHTSAHVPTYVYTCAFTCAYKPMRVYIYLSWSMPISQAQKLNNGGNLFLHGRTKSGLLAQNREVLPLYQRLLSRQLISQVPRENSFGCLMLATARIKTKSCTGL